MIQCPADRPDVVVVPEAAVSMLARFNALPAVDAELQLRSCCAAPAWAHRVAAGRPYDDEAAVLAAADLALAELPWSEVEIAVGAHARIGQPPAGSGAEAVASRDEQAGTADDDASTRAALVEVNRAYEERFGHRFLIYASGRSGAEMLAAARSRLGNDEDAERREVREQLGKITVARLRSLLTG
jgi:2-oxo-4-hydroxy-4-carboxy-5-ureidoimidazoline decarboxylase